MVRAATGNEGGPACCGASGFDRHLHRLGTAVGKEGAAKIGMREIIEFFRQTRLAIRRVDVEHRRSVDGEGIFKRFDQAGMIVADVVDAEAGEEVGIFPSLVIPQSRADGTNEGAAVIQRRKELDEGGLT